MNKEWKNIILRCPHCKRKILELRADSLVGFVQPKCKGCKVTIDYYIHKSKVYTVNEKFLRLWDKYLKNELEKYIFNP